MATAFKISLYVPSSFGTTAMALETRSLAYHSTKKIEKNKKKVGKSGRKKRQGQGQKDNGAQVVKAYLFIIYAAVP